VAKPPTIGRLRWQVKLFRRDQAPGPDGGIIETAADGIEVHADIQPLAPMTFLAGVELDTPITHRIFIRWVDWLDMRYAVARVTHRRDGTDRLDLFRIRRVAEWAGRKQYLEILAEQERRE
jgi:head-tail adaptor